MQKKMSVVALVSLFVAYLLSGVRKCVRRAGEVGLWQSWWLLIVPVGVAVAFGWLCFNLPGAWDYKPSHHLLWALIGFESSPLFLLALAWAWGKEIRGHECRLWEEAGEILTLLTASLTVILWACATIPDVWLFAAWGVAVGGFVTGIVIAYLRNRRAINALQMER